jgi:chromate reductase
MKILAISGSLRKGSYNTALLRALEPMAPEGMEIEIVTLHGIPLYDGDVETASGKPVAVTALDQRIQAADGIIIATPEYNFSIPGVLKNATDWLSRHATPFKWKRVGIIGASGGPVGTARSQYHLRQNLQALEAIVMPRPEVFVRTAEKQFDAQGKLTDEVTIKVVRNWLKAFGEWVEKKY